MDMSIPEELIGCDELSTGQDADVAGQESSNSVACQAYPETASKRMKSPVFVWLRICLSPRPSKFLLHCAAIMNDPPRWMQ